MISGAQPGKGGAPDGRRNFALLNNLTSGVADNKGIGMLFPSAQRVAIDSSVVQDGLLVFDSSAASSRFVPVARGS
jgi:hypothetical protein